MAKAEGKGNWRVNVAVGAIIVGVVIHAGIFVQLLRLGSSFDLTEGGNFGDMVGGVSALFWSLAGVLLLYETLALQRYEFIETRKALVVSQIESSFFSMIAHLSRLIELTSGLFHQQGGGNKTEKEREYFHAAFAAFSMAHNRKLGPQINQQTTQQVLSTGSPGTPDKFEYDPEPLKGPMLEAYEEFYRGHDHNLGHYFRYIYNIFKYVTSSSIECERKRTYIGILQAQMSNDELGLLFYNALSKHGRTQDGRDQFRQWLDEYQFFENIDRRCLLVEEYRQFYPKTKFKCLAQQQEE